MNLITRLRRLRSIGRDCVTGWHYMIRVCPRAKPHMIRVCPRAKPHIYYPGREV